jgi:hypothetical protein
MAYHPFWGRILAHKFNQYYRNYPFQFYPMYRYMFDGLIVMQ